jgi:hypothetical protein
VTHALGQGQGLGPQGALQAGRVFDFAWTGVSEELAGTGVQD